MDKSFLDIDVNRLDEEWVNQPKLYMEYAERHAVSKRESARLENALKLIEADFTLQIRASPVVFGLPQKPNKEVVEAKIRKTDQFQAALELVLKARHEEDILSAAVKAIEMKKTALEYRTRLMIAGIFAVPDVRAEDLPRLPAEEFRRRADSVRKEQIRKPLKNVRK